MVCGILVLLTELFSAESNSQVFASLHGVLREWDGIEDSGFNVKYAIKYGAMITLVTCVSPVRSGLTDTTKFLSSLTIRCTSRDIATVGFRDIAILGT